jgi:hypothetical protein
VRPPFLLRLHYQHLPESWVCEDHTTNSRLVVEDFQDCEFKSRVWREVERHTTDGSGFGIAGRPMVVDNELWMLRQLCRLFIL